MRTQYMPIFCGHRTRENDIKAILAVLHLLANSYFKAVDFLNTLLEAASEGKMENCCDGYKKHICDLRDLRKAAVEGKIDGHISTCHEGLQRWG